MHNITNTKNINHNYYAIGDIHGCYNLLLKIIKLIEKDISQNKIKHPAFVFLGDYIDRGPDSRKVIELLINIKKKYKSIFLKGNHEDVLLRFIDNHKKCSLLVINGGMPTLESYGINTLEIDPSINKKISEPDKIYKKIHEQFLKNMPKSHLDFLNNDLKLYYETDNYFFAHAGVRPGVSLNNQTEQDLLWIREPFLSNTTKYKKLIIHGHTITNKADINPNRIGIDTGAYHTDELTAIVLPSDLNNKQYYFLDTKNNKKYTQKSMINTKTKIF